jgi:hypothetical protein
LEILNRSIVLSVMKVRIMNRGVFKSKEINGELFHLKPSMSELMKKNSDSFRDFILEEHDGVMDAYSPSEYASSKKGGLNFEEMFAPQVRSLKCSKCQHLIKNSRFPL